MVDLTLLPESEHALSTDGGLLRTVPAEIRRPYYMMNKYLQSLEKLFVTQGGIKERMYAARTGYRKAQDEEHQRLVAENATLRAQLATAQEEIAHLRKLINKNE